jgi:hypothetical protein
MQAGAPEAAECFFESRQMSKSFSGGRERPDCRLAFVTLTLVLSG